MILKSNRSCDGFYETMGRYFADRSFIKEMDCQLYDDGFDWFLWYEDNKLCGFASVENRKHYNYLDNFYVFCQYRNKGIGQNIIRAVLNEYSNVKLITRNDYALKIFERLGFKETGRNGRYIKMVIHDQ